MAEMNCPRLCFPDGFDARDAVESEQRGYFGIAVVELPTGLRVRVCFYDPVRLAQDLASVQESGEVCIAEPGLIVIPAVTLEYMQQAVQRLHAKGYFNAFTPLAGSQD
jgi:hypothetical protein